MIKICMVIFYWSLCWHFHIILTLYYQFLNCLQKQQQELNAKRQPHPGMNLPSSVRPQMPMSPPKRQPFHAPVAPMPVAAVKPKAPPVQYITQDVSQVSCNEYCTIGSNSPHTRVHIHKSIIQLIYHQYLKLWYSNSCNIVITTQVSL